MDDTAVFDKGEFIEPKHDQGKMFDVLWQLDLKEAIGTFFLGLLSLLLFVSLRQTQKRYEQLLEQMHTADQ